VLSRAWVTTEGWRSANRTYEAVTVGVIVRVLPVALVRYSIEHRARNSGSHATQLFERALRCGLLGITTAYYEDGRIGDCRSMIR
jgi:hypothetical protein